MQEAGEEAARAQGRAEDGQAAAREAFRQASAHARSAQQAEARCQVLEQAVHRAEGRAQASAHLSQVSLHQTGVCCLGVFVHFFFVSCVGAPCRPCPLIGLYFPFLSVYKQPKLL